MVLRLPKPLFYSTTNLPIQATILLDNGFTATQVIISTNNDIYCHEVLVMCLNKLVKYYHKVFVMLSIILVKYHHKLSLCGLSYSLHVTTNCLLPVKNYNLLVILALYPHNNNNIPQKCIII